MTSGVEMGRDAQPSGDAHAFRRRARREVARLRRPVGLILTHEMFSARVERSTVSLRISATAATGSGEAPPF